MKVQRLLGLLGIGIVYCLRTNVRYVRAERGGVQGRHELKFFTNASKAMETRRRRRRRPGDGARPNGEETSPLHPRSGRSNGGSIGASGTTAAPAAATAPPASTLSRQARGIFRGATSHNAGNVHFHHQALVGNQQPATDRVRGNIMDQEMHTNSVSASTAAATESDGILSPCDNQHMMMQSQHEEETVEFHRLNAPPPRQSLWPDSNEDTSTTMTNDEGPICTESGLHLTHRPSPLRRTGAGASATSTGHGGGKNFKLKSSNDHAGDNNSHQPPVHVGPMESLSLQHQHQSQYHEQRQKRLLAYVRLGVVALCAVLAVGSKVFVSTALHEHRLMAASATAAADAAASTGANVNMNDGVGADGTRELKVMKPPSLSASAAASNQSTGRKKRHYAEEVVRTLRLEFDEWSKRHSRDYGSAEETDRRFGIWMDNHHE